MKDVRAGAAVHHDHKLLRLGKLTSAVAGPARTLLRSRSHARGPSG